MGYPSIGSQRVRHDKSDLTHTLHIRSRTKPNQNKTKQSLWDILVNQLGLPGSTLDAKALLCSPACPLITCIYPSHDLFEDRSSSELSRISI